MISDENPLPKQLQSKEFRFLIVPRGEKAPSVAWKNKETHLKYNDIRLVTHVNAGGNAGALSGYGKLVIVDADRPELINELQKKLPRTLTEKSSRGKHFFFICGDYDGFQSLDLGEKDQQVHYGEIRGDKEHQTIIAPSTHPTGAKYVIDNDAPIAEITQEQLLVAVSPFIKKKVPCNDADLPLFDCPLEKVIDLSVLRPIGDGELQGSHPVHGSTTGTNFCVNPTKGVWFCFRHQIGGNALHLIAIKESIIECGQKLPSGTMTKILMMAKAKYGLDLIKDFEKSTKEMSFDFLTEILGKTIHKDTENKIITFSAMLLAYTDSSQINIFNRAPSTTGKTYIPLEISALFPRVDVMKVGYCSPTAFFHDGGVWDEIRKVLIKDLSRKILIFLDMPHDELLRRLRPLLSHDEKEILIKITDRREKSGMRTKNVILLGFPTVIFCTAATKLDEQEATRAFILSPETDESKLRAAINLKTERESNTAAFSAWVESDINRKLLKTRISLIRAEEIKSIVLPEELEKNVKKNFLAEGKKLKPRHTRDVERFVSLIRAHTILNIWHRARDKSENIIATLPDYEAAEKIWLSISSEQERGIPPYLYRIYNTVFVALASEKPGGFSKRDILQKHWQVYDRGYSNKFFDNELIPTLEASGLIFQEPDPDDKRRILYNTTASAFKEPEDKPEENKKLNTPEGGGDHSTNIINDEKLPPPPGVYISSTEAPLENPDNGGKQNISINSPETAIHYDKYRHLILEFCQSEKPEEKVLSCFEARNVAEKLISELKNECLLFAPRAGWLKKL